MNQMVYKNKRICNAIKGKDFKDMKEDCKICLKYLSGYIPICPDYHSEHTRETEEEIAKRNERPY